MDIPVKGDPYLRYRAAFKVGITSLDQYDGWIEQFFEANGYFHLEKLEELWWLVYPVGNAFLINGQDNVTAGSIDQNYNQEHWNKEYGLTSESTPRYL